MAEKEKSVKKHKKYLEQLPDLALFALYLGSDNTLPAEVLYYRHSEFIYSISYRYFKDTEIAQEVTQKVFLKFLELKEKTDPVTIVNLKGWLSRVTRNLCHDYYNNEIKKKDQTIDLMQLTSLPDNQTWMQKRGINFILEHVENLKGKHYTRVIELTMAGWCDEAIAREIGIKRGSVSDVRRRALKQLKELIKNDYSYGIPRLSSSEL